jgi:hypothetical protein
VAREWAKPVSRVRFPNCSATKRAGWQEPELFSADAALAIHAYTGGVPGQSFALCESVLLEAAAQNLFEIDADFARGLFELELISETDPASDDITNTEKNEAISLTAETPRTASAGAISIPDLTPQPGEGTPKLVLFEPAGGLLSADSPPEAKSVPGTKGLGDPEGEPFASRPVIAPPTPEDADALDLHPSQDETQEADSIPAAPDL